MQGWVSLHRKFLSSPFWQDPYYCKLWTYCLLKASHTEHEQLIGNQVVKIEPGQFVTGRFSLHEDYNKGMKKELCVSEKTVYRWLENLEKCEMLTIKKTNKYSVVAINNWSKYQEVDQQMTNSCPTDDQQMTTNNNVNNVNNDNKRSKNISSRKQVYDKDSIPYRSASYLLLKIREFKPDLKEPNLQSWADEMRKLIETDKREPMQIARVVDWVTKDNFWKSIVLSPKKLREKWDQVTILMGGNRFEGIKGGVRPGRDQAQSNRIQGESKIYPGKWDDTPVSM